MEIIELVQIISNFDFLKSYIVTYTINLSLSIEIKSSDPVQKKKRILLSTDNKLVTPT